VAYLICWCRTQTGITPISQANNPLKAIYVNSAWIIDLLEHPMSFPLYFDSEVLSATS
jgi:hypothetical protein